MAQHHPTTASDGVVPAEKPTDTDAEQQRLRFRLVELCARGQEQFHIEYGHGLGLANHLLHGLVALSVLNAPPERLDSFYATYAQHIIDNKWQLEPAVPRQGALTESEVLSLLGAETRFLDLVDFFKAAIDQRGRVAVVSEHVARLAPAFWMAAFHPLIHLGFAFLLRDSEIGVAQGLAYLWINYQELTSIDDTQTTPSSEATEPGAILADIARDERLEQAVERASMFGGRMRSLRGNQVAHQYVFQWRELFDIDAAAPEAASRLDRCVRTLLDLTVRAHLGTGANDFFIVHLVTSSFALYMILHECGDALPLAARLVAVKHYWAGFVLAYIVQNRKPIEPFVPSGEPHEWDSVLQQAQACDEEHVIKLAMCCWWFATHSLVDEDLCFQTARKVVTNIHTGNDYVFQ